jgi:hypothetical protein
MLLTANCAVSMPTLAPARSQRLCRCSGHSRVIHASMTGASASYFIRIRSHDPLSIDLHSLRSEDSCDAK